MATAGAKGEGSASGNFAFKFTCKFVSFPSLLIIPLSNMICLV